MPLENPSCMYSQGKRGAPKLSILEGNSVNENTHLRAFPEMPFVVDLVMDSQFWKFYKMKAHGSDHPSSALGVKP